MDGSVGGDHDHLHILIFLDNMDYSLGWVCFLTDPHLMYYPIIVFDHFTFYFFLGELFD